MLLLLIYPSVAAVAVIADFSVVVVDVVVAAGGAIFAGGYRL